MTRRKAGRKLRLEDSSAKPAMLNLLRTKRRAGLLLVWFVAFVAVSVMAPMVHGGTMQLVCSSGGGAKLLDDGGDTADTGTGGGGKAMHCPLCLPIGSALPLAVISPWLPTLVGEVFRSWLAAGLETSEQPIPISRGPPLHF